MFEREGFIILTAAQIRELLAEVDAAASDAFIEGTKVGFADAKDGEAMNADDAYDQGYTDGHSQGYDEGYTDGAGGAYDDGYTDGYTDGYQDGADGADNAQPR